MKDRKTSENGDKLSSKVVVSAAAIFVTIGLNLYNKFDAIEERVASYKADISALRVEIDNLKNYVEKNRCTRGS